MMIPEEGDKYGSPFTGYCNRKLGIYESKWIPAMGIQPALNINLEYPLDDDPIPDQVTPLLCIGIEFGKLGAGNITTAVKYAGTGKIVRVG